jgi:arylsulfatase A-like enzyme
VTTAGSVANPIGTLALLLVTLVACARTDDRPSVLLVTLDTTRADYLSCYGSTRASTPSFDALAREGIRFERAVAQAGITPSSHASIMTGLYPNHHGVRVIYAASGYVLSPEIPTLASVLRDRGYVTGAFVSSFTVSEFYGFQHGFDTFDNGLGHPVDGVMECKNDNCKFDLEANQRRSDATTDAAIAWLRKQAGPTLLWVHYWDPHDRVVLPPDDVVDRHETPPNAPPGDRVRDIYAAEIEFVDQQFGRLRAVLRELGRDESTMIVVVADHGEGFGEHGHWGHRIIYQEQIHVPLLVRVPHWPAGTVVAPIVRTVDVAPTVLDVLGERMPNRIDGRSFRALMEGRADDAPRVSYAEALIKFDLNGFYLRDRPDDDLLYSLIDFPWKLIHHPTRPDLSELFNLGDDPREETNRIAGEGDVARRLLGQLEGMHGFRTEPFGNTDDPAALERLRALGYVE